MKMRSIFSVAILAALAAMPGAANSQSVSGQPEDVTAPACVAALVGGGGGSCVTQPAPLSPAQAQMQVLKLQVQQRIASGSLSRNPNTIRAALGLPPVTYHIGPPNGYMGPLNAGEYSASGAASSTGLHMLTGGTSGNWYWVSMNKWVEADGGIGGSCLGTANNYTNPRASQPVQYYYNMCGPGSAEAAISSWTNTANTYAGYYYYGYVAGSGLHWLGYMFHLSDLLQNQGGCSNYSTCPATEANVINSAVNLSYYSTDWCAAHVPDPNKGCSDTNPPAAYLQWETDVNHDIADAAVPTVAEVWTCDIASHSRCAPGWPYAADHLLSISQFDYTDSLAKYGETGSAADTCYFGYASSAPGAFSGSWPDPVTGQYYSESSGWDVVGANYMWMHTLDLVT